MSGADVQSLPGRLWQYQRERFPLAEHGPFLIAFTAAAYGTASMTSASIRLAAWPILSAVLSVVAGFLLIRLADERKDAETDRRHRPERPVPRGLVRLSELAWLAAGIALLQAALAWTSGPAAILSLVAFWAWFALTTIEFGIPAWLSQRPLLYMLSHLPNVVFLFLLAWTHAVPDFALPPTPMMTYALAAAFGAGIVFEISRKLRAPSEEQPGVETYTAAWGRTRTVVGLAVAQLGTAAAVFAVSMPALGNSVGSIATAVLLLACLALSLVRAVRFVRAPEAASARRTRQAGLLFPLVVFVVLGAMPVWRLFP